jgi:dTDP-L-rhamnose 4-epimerase
VPDDLVLVTGGAGFIGSHTVDRLLEQGYAVRVLDSLRPQVHPRGRPPVHLSPDAELVRADVRDLEKVKGAVRGAAAVVHLAAETSVGQSMYQSDVHIDVNARGTAVLFRAIREAAPDVGRVVLSSSRAVYGEGAHRCPTCGPVNPGPRHVGDLVSGTWTHRCAVCGAKVAPIPTGEDVASVYSSSYGMSKSFQESVARMEATQLGISLMILRYFNVYGPRQSPADPYTGLITTLSLRLLSGKHLVLYEDGSPIRDFVHVDDVVASNLRAVTTPIDGVTIANIGTGRGVTLRELAAELQRTFDRACEVELSPRFRVGDIHASIADVARARSVLGYEPRVAIEDGLRTLVPALEGQHEADRSDAVEDELRRQGVLRG